MENEAGSEYLFKKCSRKPLLQGDLSHHGVKEKYQPLYQKLVLNMCLHLYNDTSYEIEWGGAGGANCPPFCTPPCAPSPVRLALLDSIVFHRVAHGRIHVGSRWIQMELWRDKVNAQLHMLFALANLILATRPSLAVWLGFAKTGWACFGRLFWAYGCFSINCAVLP